MSRKSKLIKGDSSAGMATREHEQEQEKGSGVWLAPRRPTHAPTPPQRNLRRPFPGK